ncbi:DNA ligase [Novimethylophilus kurashikiensis]|uniref:DNA ligase n=1 Tax=Novimethylophilus kurashikiensis TaxID=1825523 RepID=A0A2R5FD06_9PROT|nr:hypothetical protein [Novimethylophilus kurashikiensis]GBG14581.1 DNA ligase [Novimethylophilus kurashikiensis]
MADPTMIDQGEFPQVIRNHEREERDFTNWRETQEQYIESERVAALDNMLYGNPVANLLYLEQAGSLTTLRNEEEVAKVENLRRLAAEQQGLPYEPPAHLSEAAEAALAQLKEASEPASAPAVEATNEPAPDAAIHTGEAAAGKEVEASVAAKLGDLPREATGVEKKLSTIAGDGTRQDRLVMLGDPKVEERMMDTLRNRGLLTYVGGVPQINATHSQLAKMYNEAAMQLGHETGREYSTVRAVEMEVNREPGALFGRLSSGILNAMGQKHTITVLVGGDKETVDKSLAELGQHFSKMDSLDYLNKNASQPVKLEDGKLVVPENGPLKLSSSVALDVAIGLAKAPVQDRQEFLDKVKEMRDAQRAQEFAEKENGGDKEAGKEAGKSANQEASPQVNKFASEFAEKLDKAFKEPASLAERNERKQSGAESMLYAFRGMKDPATPELGTLPTEARQTALVQLEALVKKAQSKEYGEGAIKAATDLTSTAGDSSKMKLEKLIAAEHANDPNFAAFAAATAGRMVADGIITEKQAQEMKSATQPQATAETAAPQSEASKQAPQEPQQAAQVNDQAAAKEPVKLDASAPLHERIEQMAKAGPDGVSAEQVNALMKDLQPARMSEDFYQVDTRNMKDGKVDYQTDEPAKTLARLEAILTATESGRYGQEAANQAKELLPLVQREGAWHNQDMYRYMDDPLALRLTGDQVRTIDEERAKLGSWLDKSHEASATATQAPATEAPKAATVQEQAGAPAVEAPAAAPKQAEQVREATFEPTPHPQQASTEKAVTQLAQFMSNPAGNLTTRDHQWDPRGADKLARVLGNIDTDVLSGMSPATQAEVAAQAKWAARMVEQGKLPVSDSLKDQVLYKADEMDRLGKLPLDSESAKALAKAERLESAMDARMTGSSHNTQASTGHTQDRDMSNIAKDLVHAVYKAPDMGEAYAKYTLKMAKDITPDNIKSLSPEDRARTAVALDFLARQVKEGAMGDFSSLSDAVQRHTNNSLEAADKLYQAYAKDSSMQVSMIRAENDLHARNNPENTAAKETAAGHDQGQSKQAQNDRSLER